MHKNKGTRLTLKPCIFFFPDENALFWRVNIIFLECYSGESGDGKPASSQQVEELHTQTTNLGLQLRKQMDGTSDNLGMKCESLFTANTIMQYRIRYFVVRCFCQLFEIWLLP